MINRTTIPDSIIQNIALKAGVKDLSKVMILVDSNIATTGHVDALSNGEFIIKLRQDWLVSTLAHELKHVEQVQSGLEYLMVVELQVTGYNQAWHEIEAREFALLYA